MQLATKAQIAKASLSLLIAVAALFLLGVLVLVLCAGLEINPFRETTSSFLVAAFVGLIGVALVLVLVNVATNISVIADAKIAELKVEPRRGELRRWFVAFLATAIVLVAVVFGGTYLSKERYLAIVHGQAEEVLKANDNLLEEVSHLLASGKFEDYKRVSEIRNFLEHQRNGLPNLTVIYSGTFEGKLTLYQIGELLYYDENKKIYTPAYFDCTANRDCDYLKRFFSGQEVGVMQKYTLREDQFYIYIPFVGRESRFVLLFNRTNSYGKIGS